MTPPSMIITVHPTHPEPELIARAADVLRRGGLVAFPTETVYGLGANALDAAAVLRIFTAKGRPNYNPLIVHVADVAAARRLTREWPEIADALAAAFWPGPLTLVLPKRAIIPDIVTAGLGTVAIRVPAHPVARALIHAAGLPVAAPSANRFTELSPTLAQHVARALEDRVDLIVDGGATPVGIESTVVDLSTPRPVLLRPGIISAADVASIAGELGTPTAPAAADAPRPAPGMLDRHYAPRAPVRLFAPGDHAAVRAMTERATATGLQVGALVLGGRFRLPGAHTITMPRDPAAYAHRLYAALHELDDLGCGVILVEQVPNADAWAGIADRLSRAATERRE